MSELPSRVEDIFAAALELPLDERSAYLDRACRESPELRDTVEKLLAADQKAGDFFDPLAEAVVAAAPMELEIALHSSVRIGPYRSVQIIGQGGMGVVYRAVRDDGEFDRDVALKLLHLDMDTPAARARFLTERQLLAGLSHSKIAHLLDGGVTDEGRPYFVMDFIEGVPITQYCRDHELGVEEILQLFLDVLEAVAYLHRNLIVHRDLKPGNIFVDANGEVKLLDFGIAKVLAEDRSVGGRTRTGQYLFTPEYAAPEQVTGAQVTTATDVYALGGLLFELLTGRRPFEGKSDDPSEIASRVPTSPSSVLKAGGRGREPAAPDARDPEVRVAAAISWRRLAGDLDTICLKALRSEPELRYSSAEQFSSDIERHLGGLPVSARKSTLSYRISRFLRRRWREVAAVGVVLALALVGFVRERVLRGEAELARASASREAAKATAVSGFLVELLSSADPAEARGEEVTVAEVLDQAADRLARGEEFENQPEVEATVRLAIGSTFQALSRFDAAKEHLENAVELVGGEQATTPEALSAIEALSLLHSRRFEHQRAEELAKLVYEGRKQALGENHPDTLSAINQLANALWSQGRFDEVEPLDRKTLETRRLLLGEEHPETLRSMNGLAATLFSTARFAEAAELFEQVLEARTRLLGEDHPDTLLAGSNLTACLLELGHYARSEEAARRVFEARLRVLGKEDPVTWKAGQNLAQSLALQARYEEAEELLREVVAYRKKFTEDKNEYYFSRSYLADLVRDRGRFQEAQAIYRGTLEAVRATWGSEDPLALKTASGLAQLYLLTERMDEAERLIDEVLAAITRAVGDHHPDSLGSLIILSRLRNLQGRPGEALDLAERVIAVADRAPAYDREHPLVLEAQIEKVLALRGLGRVEEASALLLEIYEGSVRRLGPQHPRTLLAGSLRTTAS